MIKVLIVSEGATELDGALTTLVRRVCGNDLECHTDRVSRRDLHAIHGKGKGYFKRAVRWMRRAAELDYDALVLVIDEDGVKQRRQEIDEAQVYAGILIRRACGVAVRTFEAWMLADEQALGSVLHGTVNRQRDPESIGDPKETCRRLLRENSSQLSHARFCAAVAGLLSIDALEQRCPVGFATFASRVRRISISKSGP